MDQLEWAVDTVGGTTFEKIAGEILRHEGYDVHESGVIGADGGWDARIEINGQKGIGHASADDNWRNKLRDDAEKVADLEKDQDGSFALLVFVTNQRVTGQQELDIENEIKEDYGWDLKILHRRHIIGITGHERPDLADRHFGFNPKRSDDHLERIANLKDERLNIISNRNEIATELKQETVAVIHLIPNGMFSGNYVRQSDDLPSLPQVGRLNPHPATKSVGKGKIISTGSPGQPSSAYTYLRKDGLYEAVDTEIFREDDGLLLFNYRDSRGSLDCKAGIAVQAGISALKEMDVTGTVFCFISLLDATGTTIAYEQKFVFARPRNERPLQTEQYTTDPVEIPLVGANVVDTLERPLTEIWQELGW